MLVKEIETGEVFKVYAVVGMQFLLWDKDIQCWIFGAINNYKPYEEND